MAGMKRRDFVVAAGVSVSSMLAGCVSSRGSVDSEVSASAEVVDMEKHEGAVELRVEVTNTSQASGSVGLHIHYWHNDHLAHTHYPTVYVGAGETKTISDTFQHMDADEIDRATAHIHEH